MADPEQQKNPKEPKRDQIKQYKYGTEFNNKAVSYSEMLSILSQNVCVISVLRRHPVTGKNSYRRMLCTNCVSFLDSYNGKVKIGFRPPTGGGVGYDPAKYNLIPTWDILMIDYRMINMDRCYLNYQYPVDTKEERNMFWRDLFNKTFYLMTPPEKEGWMTMW